MKKKFSQFTKKLIASIIGQPNYDKYYLVGHTEENNNEDNVKFLVSEILVKFDSTILASANSYQNDILKNASKYAIFINGLEATGAGLISSVNTTTGTITFNTTQSGFILLITK